MSHRWDSSLEAALRALASARATDEVGRRTAELLQPLIDFDRFGLAGVDLYADTFTAAFVTPESPWPENRPGAVSPLSGTVAGEAVASRRVVVLGGDDVERLGRRAESHVVAVEGGMPARRMIAPVVHEDRVVGIIDLRSEAQGGFSANDAALLEQVGVWIGAAFDNARTHDFTRNEAYRRSVLAEIARLAGAATSFDDIFDNFARHVRRIMRFERISLVLYDHEQSTATLSCVWGRSVPGRRPGSSRPLQSSATFESYESRRPSTMGLEEIKRRNTRDPRGQAFVDAGLRSVLIAPLFWQDRAIGALSMRSESPVRYSPRELQTAGEIAAQIAGAVRSVQLQADLRRQSAELETLAAIGRTASSAVDMNEVYEELTEQARRLIPFGRLGIVTYDADRQTVTSVFLSGVAPVGGTVGDRSIPVRSATVAETVATGRSVTCSLDELEERVRDFPEQAGEIEALLRAGYRSVLHVPLLWGGRVIGAVGFRSTRPQRFSVREVGLAEQIAAQIAGTVENARLYRLAQEEAAQRTVLAEIGRVMSSSLEIDQVYEQFAEQVARLVPFERLVVVAVNPDGRSCTDLHVAGLSIAGYEQGTSHRLDGSVTGEVVRTVAPVVVGDLARHAPEGHPGHLADLAVGLHSAMGIPLIARGEAIGSLNFRSKACHAYSERDVEVAEGIASQIAGAVANAQLHAQSLQLAREREERIRLDAENRELQQAQAERERFISTISHELRTPLTSITAFADLLARNQKGNLDARDMRHLGLVRKNALRLGLLIDDLFDMSGFITGTFRLTPSEFDVRQLVSEVADSFGPLHAEKRQELAVSLPSHPVWINADRERVAQVVLNLLDNASKYSSDGSRIELVVSVQAGMLCISVRDYGIGIAEGDQRRLFTPFFRVDNEHTRGVPGSGLGLVIARSIVELHGGTVSFRSAVGEGSTFEFTLPGALPGPSKDAAASSGRFELREHLGRRSTNCRDRP